MIIFNIIKIKFQNVFCYLTIKVLMPLNVYITKCEFWSYRNLSCDWDIPEDENLTKWKKICAFIQNDSSCVTEKCPSTKKYWFIREGQKTVDELLKFHIYISFIVTNFLPNINNSM